MAVTFNGQVLTPTGSTELLHEPYQLSSPSSRVKVASASAMHAFRTVVRLRSTRSRTERSYISVLPVELLAYIFEIGSPSPQPSWEINTYPLVIASVCRFWRDVAINITPKIWSTVIISHHYSLKLSSLIIERSGASLLDVSFYALSPLTPPALPVPGVLKLRERYRQFIVAKLLKLLLRHSHRWRSLRMICGEDQFPVVMNSLRETRAPNLRNFEVGCNGFYHIPDVFVGDGAPQISSLFLSGIRGFTNQASFSSVTKLELHGMGYRMIPGSLATFLNPFHCLEQLSLVQTDTWYRVADGQKIILPNLVALELCQGHKELGPLLVHLQAPLLRVLKLSAAGTVVWDEFWTSLRDLKHRLSSVQTLILTNQCNRPIPIRHSIFPNLTHFVLYRTVLHYPVLSASLTVREISRWKSLNTLTIYPWENRVDGEHLIDVIKGRQARRWYGSSLQKIRLVTNPSMSTGVEKQLKEMDVCLEVLPSSIDHSDISDYIGSPSLLSSCSRDAYSNLLLW